jgi:DnaJ-domain-containing protein 1
MFERLGDVIKSYLNDEDGRIFGSGPRRGDWSDPDMDAAFEELNDYLGGTEKKDWGPADGGAANRDRAWNGGFGPAENTGLPPEELRPDFAELGLPFGASAEDCKGAYKKLLKIHHPDRHANHPGNFQKATAKSARINAAYDRIEKWRKKESGG